MEEETVNKRRPSLGEETDRKWFSIKRKIKWNIQYFFDIIVERKDLTIWQFY